MPETDTSDRVVQMFQMSSETHVLEDLQPAEMVMISQMCLLFFEKKYVETLCVEHVVEACEHYGSV